VQKDAPIFFFTGCESSIDEVPDGNVKNTIFIKMDPI
jgi:hypothetical protein